MFRFVCFCIQQTDTILVMQCSCILHHGKAPKSHYFKSICNFKASFLGKLKSTLRITYIVGNNLTKKRNCSLHMYLGWIPYMHCIIECNTADVTGIFPTPAKAWYEFLCVPCVLQSIFLFLLWDVKKTNKTICRTRG